MGQHSFWDDGFFVAASVASPPWMTAIARKDDDGRD
jgi:hypothetical protein